jgi:hypothetical protein
LSRIINPESAGKERALLCKQVIVAIRELAHQSDPGAESLDVAAFIAIALSGIAGTIEPTVAAWEKRDYWVKADKFRLEWAWAGLFSKRMRLAVLAGNWQDVAATAALVAQKLNNITVANKHRLGRPWDGAWEVLKNYE